MLFTVDNNINNLLIKNDAGFSLVELSIVLVVLGLLTAGILTGQSLIRAAELRAITNESEQFQTAIHTFKGKYFGFPGDLQNATAFWAQRSAGCPDSTATYAAASPPSFERATCNGNGDGFIAQAYVDTYETLYAWHHLTNAEMVSSSYLGLSLNGSSTRRFHHAGTNCPASKASSSACWGLMSADGTGAAGGDAGIGTVFPGKSGHLMVLGIANATDTHFPYRPTLKPEEVWNIDKKLDDSRPDSGIVQSMATVPGGSTGDGHCYQTVSGERQYLLTDTGTKCQIVIFWN